MTTIRAGRDNTGCPTPSHKQPHEIRDPPASANSASVPQAQPWSCVGLKHQICARQIRLLGDRGPHSDHPYSFPGLLQGCHAKCMLYGNPGCKRVAHKPCCSHTVHTVTPSYSKHPADRSPSHYDQPCSNPLPVRTPPWGP